MDLHPRVHIQRLHTVKIVCNECKEGNQTSQTTEAQLDNSLDSLKPGELSRLWVGKCPAAQTLLIQSCSQEPSGPPPDVVHNYQYCTLAGENVKIVVGSSCPLPPAHELQSCSQKTRTSEEGDTINAVRPEHPQKKKMCDPIQENITDYPLLKNMLPGDYSYHVCSYETLGETHFRADLKIKLTEEDEVQKWLEDFQKSSCITWRKSKTYPAVGRGSNQFRVDLRCQHNVRGSAGRVSKNTSCAATLFLVLKKQSYSKGRKSRSENPHIREGYFFNVALRNDHNHTALLQKRDVSQDTCSKLMTLFENGHSPSSALQILKSDLQEQEGENYINAALDRSVCPDLNFCYRLYYKRFQQAIGAETEEEMMSDLQKRLDLYNEKQGAISAKMDRTEDGQLVIAICTPLMKRVHTKVGQSWEMVFVDSSGSCDDGKHQIFLLLTHSSAGGLPLGVLITTSENQPAITAAFQLLNSILPEDSFFGRREKGPQFIMCDDCPALRQSLNTVYPEATLIVSVFHLLQAMWRWLWNSQNGVAMEHCSHLMSSFKHIVYADTPSSLAERYNALREDPIAKKYTKFLHHLAEVFMRREEWAVCLQSELATGGHHTNNAVESAMLVLKERVFPRRKAHNVKDLVEFVTTRMEAYYIGRLSNISNNRRAKRVKRMQRKFKDVNYEAIVQEDQTSYVVPSSSGHEYHVNMAVGCCSCPVGISGEPCKHQRAVASLFALDDFTCTLPPPTTRKLYHEIATGTQPGVVIEPGVVVEIPYDMDSDVDYAMEFHPDDTGSGWDGTEELVDSEPASVEANSGRSGLEAELTKVFECLKKRLRDDPNFTAPVTSFTSSFKKLKTDLSLQSALSTFSKHPGQLDKAE